MCSAHCSYRLTYKKVMFTLENQTTRSVWSLLVLSSNVFYIGLRWNSSCSDNLYLFLDNQNNNSCGHIKNKPANAPDPISFSEPKFILKMLTVSTARVRIPPLLGYHHRKMFEKSGSRIQVTGRSSSRANYYANCSYN